MATKFTAHDYIWHVSITDTCWHMLVGESLDQNVRLNVSQVGLAVDDTKAIQEQAQIQRLSLQVCVCGQSVGAWGYGWCICTCINIMCIVFRNFFTRAWLKFHGIRWVNLLSDLRRLEGGREYSKEGQMPSAPPSLNASQARMTNGSDFCMTDPTLTCMHLCIYINVISLHTVRM